MPSSLDEWIKGVTERYGLTVEDLAIIKRMKAALEFYGDENNYTIRDPDLPQDACAGTVRLRPEWAYENVIKDHGTRAREALKDESI